MKGCLKVMTFSKNDEAVSPVIGVILMVAITVILAAVIAAFVFGMAGNISKTKVVAATAQKPDANTVTITYQGGQDAGTLQNLTVTVNDGHKTAMGGTTGVLAVGCSTKIAGTTGEFQGKTHVVVTGYFSDGTSQVLLDNSI